MGKPQPLPQQSLETCVDWWTWKNSLEESGYRQTLIVYDPDLKEKPFNAEDAKNVEGEK